MSFFNVSGKMFIVKTPTSFVTPCQIFCEIDIYIYIYILLPALTVPMIHVQDTKKTIAVLIMMLLCI